MVAKKRTIWLTLMGLTVLLIYGNCYKLKLPEPKNIKLPEETQSGKNTFGCKVDGENFKNKNHWQVILVIPSKIKGLSSYYYNQSYDNFAAPHDFNLSAEMVYIGVEKDINFWLSRDEVYEVGKKYMIDGESSSATYYDASEQDYYEANENHQIEIVFSRFDTASNIASGTFQGKLIHSDNTINKMVELTEGRFDVKFNHN